MDIYQRAFLAKLDPGEAVATGSRVYLVNPAWMEQDDSEGSDIDVSTEPRQILATIIDPNSALTHDSILIVHGIGDRFVATVQKSKPVGPPPIALPDCFCTTIPPTLTMTVNDPTRNGGMFRDCTLQYGAVPSGLAALQLGTNAFLSTATFTDQNGDIYRYYFTCRFDQLTLSRAYERSVFGSPLLDSIRYSWSLGTAGNSCVPFSLTSGQVYQGGDPASVVTIAG